MQLFRVYGHGIDNNHFHILIYDRWGEIIFETFNYQHGWDGKIKNGKFAPNGVYTWLVTFRDIQQNQHQKSGTVTLIR
ncbi:MAG: gliding motility-associated C-terminal domain-containing protein [Bacteroidia bacterium]|nr:gliding motility-associated C-terminal domain-containing protein [Bacteroidia bacterium]